MKEKVYNIVRGALSFLLIGVLLYMMRGNYGRIWKLFLDLDITLFIYSFLCFLGSIAFTAIRLRMILATQELGVSSLESLNLTFIGYFFNNFLPTAIGGDLVKVYYVAKKTGDKVTSFASVFMDRFLGLFTMMLMAAVALLLAEDFIEKRAASYIIYATLAVSVVFLVFIFNKGLASRFSFLLKLAKPVEGLFRDLYRAINNFKRHKMLFAQTIVLSVFSQLAYFYSIMLLATSIGSHIGMKELFLRVPLVCALSLLPSINGLGFREGSIVVLFKPFMGAANAFAVSVLMLAILFGTSLIGGLVYVFSPQFKMGVRPERA